MLYYFIKYTKEKIGTHKDWLKLRDTDPEKFKSLNNTGKTALVRIGSYTLDGRTKIKEYGLWEEHVTLCQNAMREVIKSLEAEIEQLTEDRPRVQHPSTVQYINAELERLEYRLAEYKYALVNGATSFPDLNDDWR
jgi:hypothetical protein